MDWDIPFNKGTPHGWQSYLPTLGQKFCLDTPRTDSSLQRITEILLKFTREYGDILACQYPLGQTLKNHPWGGTLIKRNSPFPGLSTSKNQGTVPP